MFYRCEPCRCAVVLSVQRSCSVSAGSTVQSHEAVPSCSSWQPNQRLCCWLTSAGEPAHCANIKDRHVYAVFFFLSSGEPHTHCLPELWTHMTQNRGLRRRGAAAEDVGFGSRHRVSFSEVRAATAHRLPGVFASPSSLPLWRQVFLQAWCGSGLRTLLTLPCLFEGNNVGD